MTEDTAPPGEGLRVAILGGGAIGLGAAALLASRGHRPVLWSRSGAAAVLRAEGALAADAPMETAASIGGAIAGADAVLLALPAFAHRAVLDAAAPHLRPGQSVILSGHLSFAALYLAGLVPAGVTIIAWGTTITSGRRIAPGAVRVNTIRASVDLATVPEAAAAPGLALCQRLFGDRFRARDGLLAIALSNVNPQNHMGIALCNLTRMERGEAWLQNDNITDAVGRLLEALDAERLAIADAVGVQVRSLREHFHLSFHVPPGPIGAMARAMAARGDNPQAPATLDSRYVTEDVPFGLVPTAALGRMVGRPAALHESGIALFSALYGRDFHAANDILPAFGFAGLDLPALRARARGEG